MKPLVSVVIPTYNLSHLLKERAIQSVIGQTYMNWELWVVDDGSPDDTETVVREVGKRDPRVHCLRIKNSGLAAARNAGIRQAKGEYIVLTDHDDELFPDYIAEIVAAFQKLPERTGAIGTGLIARDQWGGESYAVAASEPFWHRTIGNGWAIRRSVFTKGNIWYDDNLRACEDVDYALRFSQSYDCLVIPTPLRRYYVSIQSFRKTRALSQNYAAHQTPVRYVMEKDHKIIEAAGKGALSTMNSMAAIILARGGDIKSARQCFALSLEKDPSFKNRLYFILSYFGAPTWNFFDALISVSMRFLRVHFLNRIPEGSPIPKAKAA